MFNKLIMQHPYSPAEFVERESGRSDAEKLNRVYETLKE